VIVLFAIAYFMPVPYVRIRPGPVFNALGEVDGKPVVAIEGAETFDTSGALDITTVVEDGAPGGQITLLQAFRGWLDPAMNVVPRELLYPPEDFSDENAPDELREQGLVQMRTSEESAIVAALRYVGEPVETVITVGETIPDAPADGVLESGDIILAVDGEEVSRLPDVRAFVSAVEPGDTVTLDIERDGEPQQVEVSTVESPDDPGRPVIGVIPGISFDSQIDVTIALSDVGGPSAGLMFALSVVAELTQKKLVQSEIVAGTGEITPRGRVGPIGGIAQKMAGAEDNGADFFLAPHSNCDDVVGHVPDGLRVIAVKTLDDAVSSLEQIDNPSAQLPTCDV